MDFRGLDLNLLVAIDALFAERSVCRAGERLHLSQSATSGALARLRDAFRDPLLVQVGRTMALTPLAEGLVEPVREFLMQAEFILHASPVFDPVAASRKFRLMMSDYVETVVMTEALSRIQKVAAGISFELFSNDGSQVLERGEIDLSITPRRYLSAKHPSEHLFDDDYVCLVWSGNKTVQRSLSLDQYLALGHVIVQYGRQRQLPAFDEWFGERFERRIEVVTTTFNLVPQLLIGTSRIATVHRRLATFYEQYLPLRFVAPPMEIPRLEEFMQWHRSRDRDPGTIWLRSTLKSALSVDSGTEQSTRGASLLQPHSRGKSPRKAPHAGRSHQTR